MSGRVEDEIKRANQFGDQIEDLIIAKGECPIDDRNKLLIAHWSLISDFHRGILSLLMNKFFGSAFALVRSIVEAVIRAHVVIMGSEEDLQKLRDDNYRTNFGTVGTEIDVAFGTGSLFENFLKGAKDALHSYTHAGIHQLGRRFCGTDLTPNYSEEDIIKVIQTSTSAAFLVTNLITKKFGFEEEWRQCTELFEEWGKRS